MLLFSQVNAALQSLEAQLESTLGSDLTGLKSDLEGQLAALTDLHTETAEEHRKALEGHVADLHAKHEALDAKHEQTIQQQQSALEEQLAALAGSHSESTEQHKQELAGQIAELHAKHEALHAKHEQTVETHAQTTEQRQASLEEQLGALAAKHASTLEEQKAEQARQRERRCEIAQKRAVHRMELHHAAQTFTPWLAAARALQEQKGRAFHLELHAKDEELRTQLEVKKRHFLRCHLYIKCIILPRQARDKHRENSKTEWRFLRPCLRIILRARSSTGQSWRLESRRWLRRTSRPSMSIRRSCGLSWVPCQQITQRAQSSTGLTSRRS